MHQDPLYHDRTLFDQFQAWCLETLAARLPRRAEERWGILLVGTGLLLGVVASGLVLQAALAGAWPQVVARLAGAAGLLALAHRLLLTGIQALRRPLRRRRLRPRLHISSPVERRNPRNADARAFFERLRAAGVNVRIARALVTGGVRSAERVRAMTDEELLAIRGVGPATVRKLRACCRASD